MLSVMHSVEEMHLTFTEADKLTGPIIGRPKSATFRTSDIVGLDTTLHVVSNLYNALKHDESREMFFVPEIIQKLCRKKYLGEKTGSGFFKKTKNDQGETIILEIDAHTLEYVPQKKSHFESFKIAKNIESLQERITVLLSLPDKTGIFYRNIFYNLFHYCSLRIPEIANKLYQIDQAICAGFAWEIGPFTTWDILGVKKVVKEMEKMKKKPAQWIYDMIDSGKETFYIIEDGIKKYYDISTQTYQVLPNTKGFIILDSLREKNTVWSNSGATLLDLGDGILNLEFHTKMNTLDTKVIEAIYTSISISEKSFKGLIIGNNSQNFSAGANLADLFALACGGEFDEIDMMITEFQKMVMRIRYSSIPVIAAPSGMALGGGCEVILHADRVQAHSELYMGLVEAGVGLIPAGGGTKEMTLRVSNTYREGDPEINRLQQTMMNIATAKISTSAHEALQLGYLTPSDTIILNKVRLFTTAKKRALLLAEEGYTQPLQRNDIKVQGKTGIATFEAAITSRLYGNYISKHDAKIARKLSYVINGGDLSHNSFVSEQYLLDLEREAFLSLSGENKTLERIKSLLFKGKILRN